MKLLALTAALLATASAGCSDKMHVSYYEDMFCTKEYEGEGETLTEWDDGSCEASEDYDGYTTWAC